MSEELRRKPLTADSRMTMTGFCAFPSPGSHGYCHEKMLPRPSVVCLCPCHDEDPPPSSAEFSTVHRTTVVVQVPPVFYDDHVARGLPAGKELKRLARGVRVELDREGYDDLLDDALHYVEGGVEEFDVPPGLIRSAQATAQALRQVERPAG